MTSSRRLLSPILCFVLLGSSLLPPPAGKAETARGQGGGGAQAGRGRKVRPEPPQPGAPAASLPNLDDARLHPPASPHTPPAIASTLRSRHKPLVSRRGRRVGDPLPTPTPVAQGADAGAVPTGFNSPDSLTAGIYAFYSPRWIL